MGIWSAVKYALNSTIGTDEFKSLDYWVKNNSTESSTGTLSQKLSYIIERIGQVATYDASNSVIIAIISSSTTLDGTIVKTFTTHLSGTIRLSCTGKNTGGSGYVRLYSSEDDSLIGSILFSSTTLTTKYVDVSVNAGKSYYITSSKGASNYNYPTLTEMFIGGTKNYGYSSIIEE